MKNRVQSNRILIFVLFLLRYLFSVGTVNHVGSFLSKQRVVFDTAPRDAALHWSPRSLGLLDPLPTTVWSSAIHILLSRYTETHIFRYSSSLPSAPKENKTSKTNKKPNKTPLVLSSGKQQLKKFWLISAVAQVTQLVNGRTRTCRTGTLSLSLNSVFLPQA